MDFIAFLKRIKDTQCPRWSARQRRLDGYRRALYGKMYDDLAAPFSAERTRGFEGDRVLLDNRRAAVQEGLPNELVRDLVGMLFGESHRPTFTARKPRAKQPAATTTPTPAPAPAPAPTPGTPPPAPTPAPDPAAQTKTETDQDTSDWITAFIQDTGFWLLLIKMVWEASVGSACVVMRVLGEEEEDAAGGFVPKGKGAFHFEVWPGHECKPIFHRTAPGELKSVERVWFVGEDALLSDAYPLAQLEADAKAKATGMRKPRVTSNASRLRNVNSEWAMRIILDDDGETWFNPVPRWLYERGDWQETNWVKDAARSEPHELDEVPARWIRPLPLDEGARFPDGMCIFEPVIDFEFRINRTLSQVGRAFDYAGDPQMARIFEAVRAGGGAFGVEFDQADATGGTAADMLEQTGGDIKFVEISGDGLKAAIETYIKALKDSAREAGAMSRITPDGNARTELSAVAMKMLNFAQTVLADMLRITCVENEGALPLIRLAMRMALKVDVALPSLEDDIKPNPAATISTSWPEYYEQHGQDKLFEVQAITGAIEGGLVSQQTGVENAAGMFDVQDAGAEFVRVQADQAAKAAEVINTSQADQDHAINLEKTKGENAVAVAKARQPSSGPGAGK